MTSISVEHIEKTPGTCGGRARIAGHRIRVVDIVAQHQHWKKTPEEIVEVYPSITLADIYAALAYYHDHRDEIDADIKADWEAYEAGKALPSKLKAKLAANPELREKLGG